MRIMCRKVLRAFAVTGSFALLAVACGDTQRVEALRDEVDLPPVTEESDCVLELVGPLPSVNELVHEADAAVIGTIVQVGEPRWNSTTGEPFDPDRPPFDPDQVQVRPSLGREVLLRVERPLFLSGELRVAPGDDLVVSVAGDGTRTGCTRGGYPRPEEEWDPEGPRDLRENEAAGPVEEGARVLWVLWRGQEPLADPETGATVETSAVFLVHNYWSNWALRDGMAVHLLAERTVPEEALVGRLMEERGRGRQPDDERGRVNPLER